MALLGKLPTKKQESEEDNTSQENNNNQNEEITQPSSDIKQPEKTTEPEIKSQPKMDPNNPDFEIPTEDKLSFNQSDVNFGEEMSYDDFGDDYLDDDY